MKKCCQVSAAQNQGGRARLTAVAAPHFVDFLYAIPCSSVGQRLDETSLRITISLHLGATMRTPHMSSNFLCLNLSKTEFLIFVLPQQLSKLNNPTIHLPNNVILSPVQRRKLALNIGRPSPPWSGGPGV